MKSYFLIGFGDLAAARDTLTCVVPDHSEGTWVKFAASGDALAYFYFGTNKYCEFETFPSNSHLLQADISGRHFNSDEQVIEAMRAVQLQIGGHIYDDDDNVIG